MPTVVNLLLLVAAATQAQQSPRVDYHQHLFSPAVAALVTGDPKSTGISARDLIALLDSAGIRRALVLSTAYTWASVNRAPVENEYERVKEENDWAAAQVAQYPDRLRAFCSVNPLKDWALQEVDRCAAQPGLRSGLKLHFGNSDVDLDQPEQVAQVRAVFAAANRHRMAIVAHIRTSINRRRNYGAAQARVILNELLPATPDVPFQIAHLAGAGGYGDAAVDSALLVFVDAIKAKDQRMKNVWFDVATVMRPRITPEVVQLIASRIRQLGVQRVLYGSDAAGGGNQLPREAWLEFRKLPLTESEFRTIASNVTPFMAER